MRKKLQPPDSHHLQAAMGWIELGSGQEAQGELERIGPQLRAHPDVLAVRCRSTRWRRSGTSARTIAEALVESAPRRSSGWVHRSYALHALKRTQEAFDQLLPGGGPISSGLDHSVQPCLLLCATGRVTNARTG